MYLYIASINFKKKTRHILNNKRVFSTLSNFGKPALISFTQNFNENSTILMRYNFSGQISRKLNSKMYVSRNIQIFNNRTQLSERPPSQYPSYPSYPYQKYERFRNSTPFYQKQIFWAYTGAVGGLGGIYYVSHLETVPVTNRRRFIDISPNQEEKMAQEVYNEIMTRYGNRILPSRDLRTQYVKKVGKQIVRVSGMQGM
jgi:hypothetical protein